VRPAGLVDGHERQPDAEASLDLSLRQTLDERGGQPRAE
jgi:hypothetical protein